MEYEDRIRFQYSKDCSFTLENGEKILRAYFGKADKLFYEDSLAVTDVNDLMEYIISYNNIPKDIYAEMHEKINSEINKNGVFKIRKEQGMFICKINTY